ncbi:hypothetical protein D9758_016623 [Tetrapyrgos nigripes]|uniref:NACHT domain-containing protein n=1 Tax=Tetrapyrgos nigripes TaxID=182062 RepID=A0A8H5C9U9_9AGAR|nr:hypothetical protein D9758_016623 [Tetrapyrgos nigripes]
MKTFKDGGGQPQAEPVGNPGSLTPSISEAPVAQTPSLSTNNDFGPIVTIPDNSSETRPMSEVLAGQTALSVNMFSHASNFKMQDVTVNNAGRDIIQTTYNNFVTSDGTVQNNQMLQVLKQKLNPITNPVRKTDICMEGTRVEILQELCNWIISGNTSIAWIYGIAGTGKSAIAVSLASKVRGSGKNITLALTFHCVKGQETDNISTLIPTICYRLAQVFPEYGQCLYQNFKDDPSLRGRGIPLFEQLDTFFKPFLMNQIRTSENVVMIVIDGLDECRTSLDRADFLRCLKDISHLSWLKWVITSRPNPEICHEFDKFSKSALTKADLIDDESTTNDLRLLISAKLKVYGQSWISEEEMEDLLVKANGVFIWATTAITFIMEGVNKRNRLNAILDLKPYEGLYFLYEKVLGELFSKQDDLMYLKVVMSAVLALMEPVSVDTLSEMFSVPVELVSSDSVQTGQQVAVQPEGHTGKFVTGEVLSVAYSPDGKYVISASRDKTIRIWNVQTGQQIKCLMGHKDTVRSVVYSPDGRYIISGSDDGTIRLWDAEVGKQIGNSFKHMDQVISVACSPDGTSAVSGSMNGTIRICNIWSGKQEVVPLEGHTRFVKSVAFSSDGKQVISGSYDQTIRIWDTETGHQVGKLEHCYHEVRSVVCSPKDLQCVAVGNSLSGSIITIWDLQTRQQVRKLQGHQNVNSVIYSLDGRFIASGSYDGTIRIWDISDTEQKAVEQLQKHPSTHGVVTSVNFSPDGKHVVSGSEHIIQIWDVQTGQQVGNNLQGHTGSVKSVVYAPDGEHIVSGSHDKTVRIWKVQTQSQLGRPLKGHTDSILSVAFSPDGRNIVSGSTDKTVRIWKVQTRQQLRDPLTGHTNSVLSVNFSADGTHILSGSCDGRVKIWQVQTGQQVAESHFTALWCIDYSLDKKLVVTESRDKTIRIWDVQTGINRELQGSTTSVSAVAFSSDGKRLVSGCYDNAIRIWDLQTYQQIGEPLEGHVSWVNSLAFSADGKYVVSGAWDNTIRVWNIDQSDPSLFPAAFNHHHESQSLFIDSQGWLCTAEPEPKLILWIPPQFRDGFSDLRQILTIPCDAKRAATPVDWSKFVCGDDWTSCWTDNPKHEK